MFRAFESNSHFKNINWSLNGYSSTSLLFGIYASKEVFECINSVKIQPFAKHLELMYSFSIFTNDKKPQDISTSKFVWIFLQRIHTEHSMLNRRCGYVRWRLVFFVCVCALNHQHIYAKAYVS